MKRKKNKKILRIFKLQLWVTAIFFLVYIGLILIGGKEVLSADLNNKKRVAGATVSAVLRIFGPPEKPLILGSSSCSAKGSSSINLRWNKVVDATSYDIYRDNEELIGGLKDNFFTDESVSDDKSYSYYVKAKGPAGSAVSNSKTFKANVCKPDDIPLAKISVFEGRDVSEINGVPATTNKQPIFYGQTDIPFAIIEIEVHSEVVVYSTVIANANGSWQWSLPVELPCELHTLYMKIIDPISENILSQTSMSFRIIEAGNEEYAEEEYIETVENNKNNDESKKKEIYSRKNISEPVKEMIKKPFDFGISLENKAHIKGVSVAGEAYRGESVKVVIEFDEILVRDLVDINYSLIDSDKKIIEQYSQQFSLNDGLVVEKIIPLSNELKLGKYGLRIKATIKNITVDEEVSFVLKDKPVLKIGAVNYVTYPDLINNLSWLFIVSSVFLLFFSILLFREHYLYKRALFHITDKILKRKGFIN